MNSRTYTIAETFMLAAREKFSGNYSNVPEILKFWHNTLFLFFSSINHQRLFHVSDAGFDEMANLGLMPYYLCDFYNKERNILDKYLDTAVNEYKKEQVSVNDLRQDLLNAELNFSDGNLTLFSDKVSRDNTGSYYTPKELADEIVKKAFHGRSFDKSGEYKIADFSCGGGDFFLAIMDYLKKKCGLDYSHTIKWFYGVDIDPIALQTCIVNLLQYADRNEWETIISHFTFGNPLLINEEKNSNEDKNILFATRQLYSVGLGLPQSFFEETYDVVVGNPPWEKIRFEERKFFRGISDTIASISQKNIREDKVKNLKKIWPTVYDWHSKVCDEYSQMTAVKYKHCKISNSVAGELNTYALFTDLAYNMLSDNGFLVLIVKSTLVTAPVHQKLWTGLLSDKAVEGVFLFENKNKIFSIDSRERFVVLIASKEPSEAFKFATGLTEPKMIGTSKTILLTAADLTKINPFTSTIPNVRHNEEIAFLRDSHNRFKLFSDVYPECHFGRLIHLTAHAASIDKQTSMNNVPIYEGKFIEQYDARYATFRGMSDTHKYANKASAAKIDADSDGNKELPECRYFVHKELWDKYLNQYSEKYSLCWRSLTSPTNKRTMLAMILPTCPTCQSIQMLQIDNEEKLVLLLALFNSIPFDYYVRIKMPGLDLTQSVIKQIPVPSDDDYNEIVEFNGKKEALKKHILSYAISLIKKEDRLSELVEGLKEGVYEVIENDAKEKQKMIDLLFKKAYHLDDETYRDILFTFPKYQADHTA